MTRSPDLWTLLVRVGSLRGLTAGPGPEAAPWGGAGRPESWPVLGGSPPPRPPDPPGAAGSCRGRAGGPPAESCPTRAGALARGPTELEGPGACVSRGWAHPINRGAAEPHWPVGGNCGPPPHEHVHHTVGQTQGTEDAFGGCLGHVQARGLTAGEFVWTTWRQPLQPGKFRRPARGPRLRADRSSHPEAPNDRPPRPTSSPEPWETRVCEPRDGSRVQRTGTGPGAKEAALTQTWPGGGGESACAPRHTDAGDRGGCRGDVAHAAGEEAGQRHTSPRCAADGESSNRCRPHPRARNSGRCLVHGDSRRPLGGVLGGWG